MAARWQLLSSALGSLDAHGLDNAVRRGRFHREARRQPVDALVVQRVHHRLVAPQDLGQQAAGGEADRVNQSTQPPSLLSHFGCVMVDAGDTGERSGHLEPCWAKALAPIEANRIQVGIDRSDHHVIDTD